MGVDSSINLIALTDLKTFLDIGDSTDDTRLEVLIDAVSYFFNNKTNRQLKARALTEYYDGDGTNKILLNSYPVNSITTLHISTDVPRTYGSSQLINSDYYDSDTEGVLCYFDGVFPKGFKTVKIAYNGGYSTIPHDLEQAALIMCQYLWMIEKHKKAGMQSISQDRASVSLKESDIPDFVSKVLEKYERKYFG
jgi:hypothetical protein